MSTSFGGDNIFEAEEGEIEVGKGSPAWMTTYSDLVTQLLIFFVMMFALASTLNELQLREIKRRLEIYAVDNQIEDVLNLEISSKGLTISLSEKLMFDSGEAVIYDEAKLLLADISTEIIDIPNDVRVEGHTDSIPIKTDKFPSNWELSTSRATNVARFLVEELDFPPDRISAGGYSKYQPAVQTAYDNVISDYRQRVRDVPSQYSEALSKAKLEEEKEEIHSLIRAEQYAIQREMQDVLQMQIAAANSDSRKRALNRRVDMIVSRLGAEVEGRGSHALPEENLN
ncbi:MAG: OmpA family protein [Elusimicrobia bacterium]|nr:OmpA family protein [Elusimicrobiota bacterium]